MSLTTAPPRTRTTAGTRAHRVDPRQVERAAVALFVASRLVIASQADAPVMSPDEPGAWAIAKWLSGTPGAIEMGHMPVYPVVSGVVLTPLWWLPIGGELRYQLGLVVAGALVLAAALLVRRAVQLLDGEGWPAALAMVVILLLPSSAFGASFTHAEPTVLLLWAVLMWGLCAQRDRLRPGPVALLSVAAGAAPFVHGRLVAVPLLWTLHLVLRARRERATSPGSVSARAVWVALALMSLTAACGLVLTRALTAALWTDPEPSLKGDPTAWMVDPSAWVTFAEQALGQLWYVLIASAGLAVAGVAQLLELLRRPERRGDRVVGATLGAMLAANLAVSVTAMGGFLHESGYRDTGQLMPPRVDHLVYGRYNDAAVLVLTCLGILWCWRRGHRRALTVMAASVAAVVTLGGVIVSGLVGRHPDLLAFFPTPNIAAVSGVVTARGAPGIGAFTVGGAFTAAVVLLAAARGRRAFVVILCGWAVLGSIAATHDAVELQRAATPVDLQAALGAPTGAGHLTVAADASRLPGLVGNGLPGRYLLVSAGWDPVTAPVDSDELARSPGDAEALLLVDGVDLGSGWLPLERNFGARLWVRTR